MQDSQAEMIINELRTLNQNMQQIINALRGIRAK